jgi:ABC-2 type transport system ATP-binding protein
MAIEVDALTKTYGTQRAVDAVSFKAASKEILGFLGPNGAGKSTTMKMLTGYLEPDSGTARVNGLDIREHAVETRRHIGYLPEHNPLYLDMYIREYLEWVGRFYRIPRNRARVQDMIGMIGLGREQHKRIGQLSKGYRQRVGLAQALLHDPDVLILDEPTAGLDPNQLAEIRSLIRELGRNKTIIFSTHIMQEVAALCDRVVIIHRGSIVADGPVSALEQQLSGTQQLVVRTLDPVNADKLSKIPGVKHLSRLEDGRLFRLVVDGKQDIRADVFRCAVKEGWVLTELHLEARGVEDVFQELTRDKL